MSAARTAGPWPNPSLSYSREQLFAPAVRDLLGVGLTIPLPLFDRNRPSISRAPAAHRAAVVSQAAWRRLRPLLLRETGAALADPRRRLRRYRSGALSRLPVGRRAARSAFMAGGSLVSLLEAQDLIDRHTEVEPALRRRVRKLFLDLHELSGQPPNS